MIFFIMLKSKTKCFWGKWLFDYVKHAAAANRSELLSSEEDVSFHFEAGILFGSSSIYEIYLGGRLRRINPLSLIWFCYIL